MSGPAADVVVVGAGAAGLMTAAVAAQGGRRVLVLERNRAPGRKVLVSGGGRCNFTNLDAGPDNYLSGNPHFAKSALARFTPRDFLDLVEDHGIEWREKHLGQLFCVHSSKAVLGLLLERCRELLSLCGDRIAILSGDDATARQLMLAGGKGNISVTANLVPQQMHEMCKRAIAGDAVGAEAIDTPLAGLHSRLFVEGNPVPVKWAMAQMGLIQSGLRLPLVELNPAFRVPLTDAMRAAGISISI